MIINDMAQLRSLVDLGGKELYFGGPEGFDAIEKAFSCLDGLGAKGKAAVAVKYKGQYYPILMQSFSREVIIGMDRTWFKEDGYFLVKKTEQFKMPYNIDSRVKKSIMDGILKDMLNEDPSLKAYVVRAGIVEEDDSFIHESNNYPVLLGLTFKDDFYTKKELHLLRNYFKDYSDFDWFMSKYGIESINPFKSLAIKGKKLLHYQIITTMDGWTLSL